MYVEAREITQYQDSIKLTDLKVGGVYYMVGFYDDIASIHSLVFIGNNLDQESQAEGVLYFQDSISYFAGIRYGNDEPNSSVPALFLTVTANNLSGVYNLEAALEILTCHSLE
jgi:hypothetical protein